MWAFSGLLERPATTIGELAHALGIEVADLADYVRMGHLATDLPTSGQSWADRCRSARSRGIHSLSGRYAWDIHHQQPVPSAERLPGTALQEYAIEFTGNPEACEAELQKRYGPPELIFATTGRYDPPGGRRRYRPFFVAAPTAGGFVLEWYAREPEWAIAEVDPAARDEFLRTLVRALEIELDGAAVVRDLEPLAGRARAELSTAFFSIRFHPPLPIAQLFAATGWEQPVAITTGIYMDTWYVLPHADFASGGVGARVGAWTLRSLLEGPPRRPDGSGLPALGRHGLGPVLDVADAATRVTSISIGG
jgi:hypothetical protein